VFAQADDVLARMIERPAVSDRPMYLQDNSVLARFVSFARFHRGDGEFG
jgi:hypothetical protein